MDALRAVGKGGNVGICFEVRCGVIVGVVGREVDRGIVIEPAP